MCLSLEMETRPFSIEDVLLLYSIAYASHHHGEATFERIFAAEDAINRSAPLQEELESGLALLIAVSLVERSSEGYVPTISGRQLYDEVNAAGGSVSDRLDRLERRLHESYGAVAFEPTELDSEAVRAGYDAYYHS